MRTRLLDRFTKTVLPADNDERDEDIAETWDVRNKLFSERQNHLWALRQSSFEKSDELIVTVSSAFLALSVGFVKEIVRLSRSVWMPLLIISWVCFFGAIILNFISHLTARTSMDVEIEYARLYYLEGRKKFETAVNPWSKHTGHCNMWAASLFAAGVVLTLIFVSKNIMREQYFQVAKENELAKTKTTHNSPAGSRAGAAANRPRATPADSQTR